MSHDHFGTAGYGKWELFSPFWTHSVAPVIGDELRLDIRPSSVHEHRCNTRNKRHHGQSPGEPSQNLQSLRTGIH